MNAQQRMTLEERGEDRRAPVFGCGDEEAQAPGDDFRIKPSAFNCGTAPSA